MVYKIIFSLRRSETFLGGFAEHQLNLSKNIPPQISFSTLEDMIRLREEGRGGEGEG
jgi:hypothetical protein